MIYEVTPQVLVQMFETDNVIRCVILDGIPKHSRFIEAKINRAGNVELIFDSAAETMFERKAITIKDLRGT